MKSITGKFAKKQPNVFSTAGDQFKRMMGGGDDDGAAPPKPKAKTPTTLEMRATPRQFPAEWEPHEAVWLGFPPFLYTNASGPTNRDASAAVCCALADHGVKVRVATADAADRGEEGAGGGVCGPDGRRARHVPREPRRRRRPLLHAPAARALGCN